MDQRHSVILRTYPSGGFGHKITGTLTRKGLHLALLSGL